MPQKSPLIFFCKNFKAMPVDELIETAHRLGFEGYDLPCRPGMTITPENVSTALPEAVKRMHAAGLVVPMISGTGNLVEPTDPTALPILRAMQESGIGFLKLGYYMIDNAKEDYWQKVDYVRKQLDGWAALGEKHGVKICYHTHSQPRCMGLSAGAVMHLVQGFDPRWIGVYLDPAHLMQDGEHPDIAVNMTKKYLSLIGIKDSRKIPSPIGKGWYYMFTKGGCGDVDWARVFELLKRVNYQGPLSIHGEYEDHYSTNKEGKQPEYLESLREEFTYFRKLRDAHGM